MRTLCKVVLIAGVMAGKAFASPEEQYTVTGRLSATSLVDVIGPTMVRATVYLFRDGRPVGPPEEVRLRPVDTDKDSWIGEFQLTGGVSEGAYIRVLVLSGAVYPDGRVLWLQGSTVVYTGIDRSIDIGILSVDDILQLVMASIRGASGVRNGC